MSTDGNILRLQQLYYILSNIQYLQKAQGYISMLAGCQRRFEFHIYKANIGLPPKRLDAATRGRLDGVTAS
jgi:hypothetical protein